MSYDKFSAIDPAKFARDVEEDNGSPVIDKFGQLDPHRARQQIEAAGIDLTKYDELSPEHMQTTVDDVGFVDVDAPDAPVITSPVTATYITNSSAISVQGTAEAGSTVKVYQNAVLRDTVTANGIGNWTASVATITYGTLALTATATDSSNNVSDVSDTVTVTRVHNPVVHYTFDSADVSGATINDVSGNGHHGTAHGSVSYVAGHIGDQAIHLDNPQGDEINRSEWVEVANHADWGNATSLTFSLWGKITDVGNNGDALQYLISTIDATASRGFSFGQKHNNAPSPITVQWRTIGIGLFQSPDSVYPTSGPSTLDGNWHHYVAVYDENHDPNVLLYIDGVAQSGSLNNSQTPNPLRSSTGKLTVGAIGATGFGLGTTGDLDDVRVYNVALNAAEVSAIYGGHV